ncbi:RHS repeat-associated core domain-containing protein [Paludibaculum fermentans]|uniref:RHS repeat-associated core domain-containing protein n=1 Tax=Paludibaculum fermentans TaxID=1473598 RepID=A0A7S7SMK0_PALFE|nr:RHS repeat-associated core domain-containing protein [Paludibaculum fermentans]QOY91372.1 hypothetical protein IRI77_15905 [Paludibaculum fermentans]
MVKRYPVSTGAEDVNQRTTNTYDYDGSNSSTRNLWGRLAAVTVPNSVTEHYSYTSAGLLTSKASDFGGGIYMVPTVDYSYDTEGRMTQMVYPQYGHLVPPSSYAMYSQRLTLNYSYDSLGQLQGMTAGSGPGTQLVSSATYNAAGQLLSLNRPNSVTVDPATELPSGSAGLSAETFQYNGRNQLTRQTFLYSDIEYRFSATANDGRLTQKKNWNSTEEENYTYDSLGRVATAYTTGPEWGLSWVYDGFGNRLQQNVTKGTAPSTVQTVNAATNRLNGAGFGYDSNGNMTDWTTPSGSVTASYDIDNRMTQIVTPSLTETYKYGPGNLRVRKSQGGTTVYTVYGQGGAVLGTYTMCTAAGTSFLCDARLRVYFGGRLILNGWTGVKPDRLGSPDFVHGRVYPYGEVSGSVTEDQDETFTTYKRDVYTGLDYAQNRYYASGWGRFATADPYRASGGPASPQSWNRYAYVEGDPVNFGDPAGTNKAAPDSPDVINGCIKSATTWDELACRQNGGQQESGGGGWSFDPMTGMPAALQAAYDSYSAMVTEAFIDRAAKGFKITSTIIFDDDTTSEHSHEGQFDQVKTNLLSLFQAGLDVAGLVPGIGEVADGLNGAIYLAQGDWGNAALSAASMIPIGGQLAGGTRIAKRFVSHESALIDLAKQFKRRGLNSQEVDIMRDWAKEYGVYFRGPEAHPNRNFTIPHVHIGPIDHIPVRP